MQRNALLLQRRAPSIARLGPIPRRVQWALSSRVSLEARRRWFSATTPRSRERGQFLGSFDFPELGGKHLFRVKLPPESEQGNIEAWTTALETCLPPHLRRGDAPPTRDRSALLLDTQRDIALILIEAWKAASFDLLGYIGVVQERWEVVSWIVDTVARRGLLQTDLWLTSSTRSPLSEAKADLTLDEFTGESQELPTKLPQRLGQSLKSLTLDADPRSYDTRLQRGALGQIWQSLGSFIVRAAEGTGDNEKLMPHVLNLLATLHHYGIVPESVYKEAPNQDIGAAQQPPLLHMLSSRILTALSDAAWSQRQSTATDTNTEKSWRGRNFAWSLGPESPGVRYSSSPQELRPEVWLELVLWSCLRGGWVEEGIAVLEQICPRSAEDKSSWSLISWRKVLESSESQQTYSPSFGWRDVMDILEGARPELQPRPSSDDKASVAQTVSSELIAAYVQASIASVNVGVGQRGMGVRQVLDHVKGWKYMLGRQNLGLGFATWDVIVQQFIESGGIWLERDPAFVLEILQLNEPYGREEELVNISSTGNDKTSHRSYFTSPSALPLNLLHRVLVAQAQADDLPSTMATMQALQDFTERNQRRSIQQFFQNLQHRAQEYQDAANQGVLFDTSLAAAEYPSFYPQLPVPVLARFLSIAKTVKDREFYTWVFDSDSAVGPLISEDMYKEPGLAPALVAFASATDNQHVLQQVMLYHSELSRESNALIPTPIVTSLLETLIQRRKWVSVRRMLKPIHDAPTDVDRAYNDTGRRLFPIYIGELLRIEHELKVGKLDNPKELLKAWKLFVDMVDRWMAKPRHLEGLMETEQLICNVALLASVDETWSKLCNNLCIYPSRSVPLRIRSIGFRIVLEAVLETRGMAVARRYWETWCHTANYIHRTAVAEGGVYHLPRTRPNPQRSRTRHYITVETFSERDLSITGKMRPSLAAVRVMLQGWRKDLNKEDLDYDHEEMGAWLKKYFQALSYVKHVNEAQLASLTDGLEM